MKTWAGVGEAYAHSYASLCAGTTHTIASMLGEPGGRDLLDVGAGTGELAASLEALGWSVVASEPEATMRGVAARLHPRLTVVDAGLPSLPFSDAAFDAVTANFVLNHVRDPRAAAREITRVAAAGAPLVATIWLESPSWFWKAVCERAGLVPSAGERLAEDKDFARTAAGFAGMLSDAGWMSVGVSELTWTWHASPVALWASARGGVASAGAFYASLDAPDRVLFRDAFEQMCAEHDSAGAIALVHTAAIALGRAC